MENIIVICEDCGYPENNHHYLCPVISSEDDDYDLYDVDDFEGCDSDW